MAHYFNLLSCGIVCLIQCCLIQISVSADEASRLNFTRASNIKELLISAYQESLQRVDTALVHTRQRHGSPAPPTHMFLRRAERETREVSRAAEVFETTLHILKARASRSYTDYFAAPELLSWADVELLAELSGCPRPTAACLPSDTYRSISGLCNNRQHPLWGAANTALVRWLPAEYEDAARQPKGWSPGRLLNGFPLPPVREVSQKILQTSREGEDEEYSQLLVEWGQYLDHDITFTPQSTDRPGSTRGPNCSTTCENEHPCFPIQLQEHDPLSAGGGRGCLPFLRSSPACFSDITDVRQALQRQQMNSVTSFMDASTVYGHTPHTQALLRDPDSPDGRLAVNARLRDSRGRAYLPFVAEAPSGCSQDPRGPLGDRVECFSAGDSRVSEGLPLTALHTLMLREHNRVAAALKGLNAHWGAETVYQEARKVVGALHQIINMRDYIPKIIGPESLDAYLGPYGGYDPTVDPSASNVFATAAFRFGHATIPSVLRRLDEDFQEHARFPPLSLHSTLFSPWRIVKEGGIEPVLRGLLGTAAATLSADDLLVEELTERLVVMKIPQMMDLASLNLQRGRDHGLPGYNDWRVFCGLKRMETERDFRDAVKDVKVAEKVLALYGHPDNIDVWLGGLVEDMLPGARTGPLFSCLVGKQMKAIRDGDRFWWEAEGVFTQRQRTELSRSSLSRLICDNSDVAEVPLDAFRFRKYPADFLPCERVPAWGLDAWREEPSGAVPLT